VSNIYVVYNNASLFKLYFIYFYIFNFYLQPKGHSRVPSSTDLKEFKEVTQRDSLVQLEKEMASLLATTPDDKKDLAKSQFTAFSRLFQRFLEESGPSVDWEKIEKLPADAVSVYNIYNINKTYISICIDDLIFDLQIIFCFFFLSNLYLFN